MSAGGEKGERIEEDAMPETRIPFGDYELVIPEDDEEALAVIEKFLTGVQKLRESRTDLPEEELAGIERYCEQVRADIEACKKANAEVARTGLELEKARAAVELELQREATRKAQAEVSKTLRAKKARFND